MPVVRITDPSDPRLADYVSLTDVALRSRHEPAKGLYIAESSEVIRIALGAGHRPRSFLMAERWLEDLGPVLAEVGAGEAGAGEYGGGEYGGGEYGVGATGSGPGSPIPVFIAEPEVLRTITGFHLHRGALAAMHRPALPQVGGLLAKACSRQGPVRVVVLEDIVDHTNVGAIFRSVAGLGAHAVLVSPRCADPLYRRSVRVSMGTVFLVPWTRMPDWQGGLADLRSLGFVVAALGLGEDSVDLGEFSKSPPVRLALVFGTEGHGLSPTALGSADISVRIPMSGGVDSLNVAAASAVALWSLRPSASEEDVRGIGLGLGR